MFMSTRLEVNVDKLIQNSETDHRAHHKANSSEILLSFITFGVEATTHLAIIFCP
jgi:hypothetical protein